MCNVMDWTEINFEQLKIRILKRKYEWLQMYNGICVLIEVLLRINICHGIPCMNALDKFPLFNAKD